MIKAASLFSGCGGMDLGFIQAGIPIVWANEIDTTACDTYRYNIGNHVVCKDIRDIDPCTIPDVNLILGGFPCQDFSMIWKRGGIETDRGNLYRTFVDIVDKKRPAMFVAENVKGLLSANKGKAIAQIIEDFSKSGYKVTPHLINFADYGVAQLRERVLLVGVSLDIKENFILPKPIREKANYLSAKEALSGVEAVEHNNRKQKIKSSTVEKLSLIPPGGNFSDIPPDSPHYVKGMISHVYRRLHPDKPSTTIIASGGGGTWGYHYEYLRSLTNRERARLFGYPDDFIFKGSMSEVRRQIGNSVPPSGIRIIAESVKDFLSVLY